MGLEDMINRIEQEAQKEADEIIQKARSQAESIRVESLKKIGKEVSEKDSRLEKECSSRMNILISEGRRKSRQAILTAKEDLIWDAIANIRSRLSSLQGDDLLTFLEPLYARAADSLGTDLKIYAVRKIDQDALKTRVSDIVLLSDKSRIPSDLSRYSDMNLLGGFIATSSDSSRMMNMTFAGILEKEEERIRENIARTLFGE